MPDHKYDNEYYFKKIIEPNGEYCGSCKYTKNQICYFFGEIPKSKFDGQTKRHKKCIDAEEKK